MPILLRYQPYHIHCWMVGTNAQSRQIRFLRFPKSCCVIVISPLTRCHPTDVTCLSVSLMYDRQSCATDSGGSACPSRPTNTWLSPHIPTLVYSLQAWLSHLTRESQSSRQYCCITIRILHIAGWEGQARSDVRTVTSLRNFIFVWFGFQNINVERYSMTFCLDQFSSLFF